MLFSSLTNAVLRSQQDSECSEDDEVAESAGKSAMSLFNAAMEKLNQVATNAGQVGPLTFQLKTTWNEATENGKEVSIDKATEACCLVCDVIAPKAGQELFQSRFTPDKETDYADLPVLVVRRHGVENTHRFTVHQH